MDGFGDKTEEIPKGVRILLVSLRVALLRNRRTQQVDEKKRMMSSHIALANGLFFTFFSFHMCMKKGWGD